MITRDEIFTFALALPPADREVLATALQDSLEPRPDPQTCLMGDEFLAELQRRSAAYRADPSIARPADEFLAEMRQRQADEAPL